MVVLCCEKTRNTRNAEYFKFALKASADCIDLLLATAKATPEIRLPSLVSSKTEINLNYV